MFVGTGKLPYDWKKLIGALSETRYHNLRRALEGVWDLPAGQSAVADIEEYGPKWRSEQVITDRIVGALSDAGIEVTLSNVRGLEPHREGAQNTIYQIMVPDIGVMQIKNVSYLYDCDERTINNELDRGWRILCISPPRVRSEDQHPSYVIGHTKPPE